MYDVIAVAEALAVPSIESGQSAFEDYVYRLVDWGRFARQGWVTPCSLLSTVQLLHQRDAYPLRPHIQSAVAEFQLREFSPHDIARIAETFLADAPFFDQLLGVRDILWESEDSPCGSACECEAQEFHDDLEGAVVKAGLSRAELGRRPIVMSARPHSGGEAVVRATLEIVEFEGDFSLECPYPLEERVPVAHDYCSIVSIVDCVELWLTAQNEDDAESAIAVAYEADRMETGNDLDSDRMALGRNFLSSARRHGFMTDSTRARRLLSAVVGLLARRNRRDAHALRVNSGGGSPPVLRGDDVAVRLDLDHEYHLHFWRLDSGGVELADVVTHNVYRITS